MSNYDEDIAFERIVSIEYDGIEQVYDIAVSGTHNFVAEGLVAHNTYITGGLGVGAVNTTNGTGIITGKLGVGAATAPTYAIDATGLGHFTGLVDAANFTATSSSATTTLAGMLAVGSNALNVLSNGNVGIGTASPGARLSFGTSLGDKIYLYDNGTPSGSLGFGTAASTFNIFTDAAGTDIKFKAGGSSGTDLVTFKGTGNVGIGTTTPQFSLSVSGNAQVLGELQAHSYSSGMVKISPNAYSYPAVYALTNAGATTNLLLNPGGGNVGIGTTTPQTALSVVGTHTIAGDTGGLQLRNSAYGASGFFGSVFGWTGSGSKTDTAVAANGSNLQFFSNNSSTAGMTINSSGNVGIGTTTPLVKLDISGSTYDGAGNLVAIRLDDTVAGKVNSRNWLIGNNFGSNDGDLSFGNSSAAGGNPTANIRMTLNKDGNIGIGTTTPNSLLTVSGSSPVLRIADTAASGVGKLSITDASGDEYTVGRDNATGFLDFNGTQTSFSGYKWRVNNGTEVLRITNAGNVGIGTTTPSQKFEVMGGRSNFTDNSGSYTIGATYKLGDGTYWMGASDSASPDLLFSNAAGTERLRLTNSGNVGIGTTAPGGLLDLNTGGVGSNLVFSRAGTTKGYLGTAISFGTAITDDLNIRSEGSNILFGFSGAEKARITSAGNVGIGNTSPGNKLTVGSINGQSDASIVARSPTTGNSFEFGHGNSAGYFSVIGNESGSGKPFIAFNAEAGSTTNAYTTLGVKGTLLRGDLAGGLTIDTVGTAGASNQTPSNLVTILNSGNVGIGTTSPASLLTVVGGGACFSGSGATVACGNTAGNLYYRTANTGTYDIAENYPTFDASIATSTIVALDTAHPGAVVAATSSGSVFGVVSTDPGLVLGGADATASSRGHKMLPIALSGRVPVRVSLEGGAIGVGDQLSLSSITGIAKKAKDGERSIGYALENYAQEMPGGKVEVFITHGTFAGISVADLTQQLSQKPPSESAAGKFLANIFARMREWFADATNGITEFFAKRVRTDELCVGDQCLNADDVKAILKEVRGQSAAAADTQPLTPENSNTPQTPMTQDAPQQENTSSTPTKTEDTSNAGQNVSANSDQNTSPSPESTDPAKDLPSTETSGSDATSEAAPEATQMPEQAPETPPASPTSSN